MMTRLIPLLIHVIDLSIRTLTAPARACTSLTPPGCTPRLPARAVV